MPDRLARLGANRIRASVIRPLMTAQTRIWLVMPCGRKADGFTNVPAERERRIIGQRGNEGGQDEGRGPAPAAGGGHAPAWCRRRFQAAAGARTSALPAGRRRRPISSATKPISAISVPISLRNQIWSSTGRGVPPCRVFANQSRL